MCDLGRFDTRCNRLQYFLALIDSLVRDGGITDRWGATVRKDVSREVGWDWRQRSALRAAYEAAMVPSEYC